MSTSDTRLRFLGHFNGSDGSKTIVDNSTYSNTVTNNSEASVELDTGVKKYGTASLMCDLIVKDTEAGTDDTEIVITSHGLSVGDNITLKDVFVLGDSYETTVASTPDSDTFTVDLDMSGTRWVAVFQKFGTACGQFDGTGDYLSIADSSDWDFGSGDFTIDFWINFNSISTSYVCPWCQRIAVGDQVASMILLRNNASTKEFYFQYNNGALFYVAKEQAGVWETDTWYHLALVRDSSTLRFFIDGVQIDTESISGTITNSTALATIGMASQGTQYPLNGYIDEFRVSKGIARWTSNFTPPTSAYTSDANTQLLLHMDGTSGSTTFTDDGNTGHTVTANGDAELYGTSSDGSGELVHYYHEKKVNLALPSNNLQDNVTFRFWFQFNDGYPSATPTENSNIIGYDDSGTEQIIYMDTNNKINVEGLQSTTVLSPDTWYFIQYSAGLTKHWLHIDGTLEDSATLTTPKDYTAITNFVLFDETANDNNLDSTTSQAWIDDLQIWETALYGGDNFTAPIAEYSDSEFTGSLLFTNYGLQVDINLPPPELWVTNFGYQVDILTPTERGLKYWNGASWEEKPLKYWNGSSWEVKTLKYWTGSEWA